MNYLKDIKDALNAGVPIIIVKTGDYESVMKAVSEATSRAVLRWDIARGVREYSPKNEAAVKAAVSINGGEEPALTTYKPTEALGRALESMPSECVLFMENFHILLESRDDENRMTCLQAVSNCRDSFEKSGRTVALLCPDMTVPPELTNDVISISVPLPGREELAVIAKTIHKAGQAPDPDEAALQVCSGALLGLSSFAAKQVASMCITRQGMNIERAWGMKIEDINRVQGLRAERGRTNSFDQLLGLDNIVEFGQSLLAGEEPPEIIVLMDEAEKQFAGGGDSTGIGKDQEGQLLTYMEEKQWDGMLLPGFPGTGKTEFAKCLGARAGLFIWMDLGGMKNKYVGESEARVRAAMDKLYAIAGSRVFFVCTCNNVQMIPTPLFRRLSAGTYFFDFPQAKAQRAIWKQYMEVNSLPEQEIPPHVGWTGAEIKKCCMWARRLRQTLVQSANRITPAIRVLGDDVLKLRKSADNKYLSASSPGWYQNTDLSAIMPMAQRNIKQDN